MTPRVELDLGATDLEAGAPHTPYLNYHRFQSHTERKYLNAR